MARFPNASRKSSPPSSRTGFVYAVLAFLVATAACSGCSSGGTQGGSGVVFVPGQDGAAAIAVDEKNIYWVNAKGGQVMKAGVADGKPTLLAKDQKKPQILALDETGVFWSQTDDFGAIMEFPKVPAPTDITRKIVDDKSTFGLAVDKSSVYYVTTGVAGRLVKASISGAERVDLATGLVNARQVAVDLDGNGVFVVVGGTGSDGSVVNVPPGAGPKTVASGLQSPSGIALEIGAVWVASRGGILKVSFRGSAGAVSTVCPAQGGPEGIAIEGDTVFWVNPAEGLVLSCPKSGGTPTVLASGQQSPTGIAANRDAVWFTTANEVMKIVR